MHPFQPITDGELLSSDKASSWHQQVNLISARPSTLLKLYHHHELFKRHFTHSQQPWTKWSLINHKLSTNFRVAKMKNSWAQATLRKSGEMWGLNHVETEEKIYSTPTHICCSNLNFLPPSFAFHFPFRGTCRLLHPFPIRNSISFRDERLADEKLFPLSCLLLNPRPTATEKNCSRTFYNNGEKVGAIFYFLSHLKHGGVTGSLIP